MNDRIKLYPARLFLTDEAASKAGCPEGVHRSYFNVGKQRTKSIWLEFKVGSNSIVRIHCRRLDSGNWLVISIDCNLPAALYGHNGRPIRALIELALALTRVRHLVSLVTKPEGHQRIIPGVGHGNMGFIHSVEIMVQIQDPGHLLLCGSHFASRLWQHESPLVRWGLYTKFTGTESELRFYDKSRQRAGGVLDPPLVDGTRVECVLRNPEAVAKAAKDSLVGDFDGEVVSTLSPADAYAILRAQIANLNGFGTLFGNGCLPASRTARNILVGLGDNVTSPHQIDRALEEYGRMENPTAKTFREVSKAVREHAMNRVGPNLAQLLPEDLRDLQWSDVRRPADEREFQRFLRDTGCPMTADPDIVEAWATTSFLKARPTGGELTGSQPPTPPCFRRNTL